MNGQNDNGTVTLSPTDDELFEIEREAAKRNPWPHSAAGRRALYDAGQGKTDWLLDKEAAEFVYRNPVSSFAEAMDLCRYLHDRITGGDHA